MYTKEQAAKHAEILKAFAEDKPIQVRNEEGDWEDVYTLLSLKPDEDYRIAQYAPCDIRQSLIGRMIKTIETDFPAVYMITAQDIEGVWIATRRISYMDLLRDWVFINGAPCGVI